VDSRHFRIDYRWATNDPGAADAQRGRAAVSGLTSYGVDVDDMCRGRLLILEREKPADLLVQARTRPQPQMGPKVPRSTVLSVEEYLDWIGQ
jgi:hypothetical protein